MLLKVFEDTCTLLQEELTAISLDLFNESIFRYLFCKSLLKNNPGIKCHIEWFERVDLYIQGQNEKILVEFKFYLYSKRDGKLKGYPSNKNFNEFAECVKKLEGIEGKLRKSIGQEAEYKKHIILAYVQSSNKHSKNYENFYNDDNLLAEFRSIKILDKKNIKDSKENNIVCKLLQVASRTT